MVDLCINLDLSFFHRLVELKIESEGNTFGFFTFSILRHIQYKSSTQTHYVQIFGIKQLIHVYVLRMCFIVGDSELHIRHICMKSVAKMLKDK